MLTFILIAGLYQIKTFFQKLQDNTVTDYYPVFFPTLDYENKLYVVIKYYKLNNKPHFLVVGPNTLHTYQKNQIVLIIEA